jgi:hypothetical protein
VLVILLASAAILTKLQSIDKEQQYKLAWADGLLEQVGRWLWPPAHATSSPHACSWRRPTLAGQEAGQDALPACWRTQAPSLRLGSWAATGGDHPPPPPSHPPFPFLPHPLPHRLRCRTLQPGRCPTPSATA